MNVKNTMVMKRILPTLGTLATGLLGLIVQVSPSVSQACAVCTAGRDEENQLAFLLSTLGMSLMPLFAIGTLVFVLWRRYKKLESEGNVVTASVSPGVSASLAANPRQL
jgi:hypothetical protein